MTATSPPSILIYILDRSYIQQFLDGVKMTVSEMPTVTVFNEFAEKARYEISDSALPLFNYDFVYPVRSKDVADSTAYQILQCEQIAKDIAALDPDVLVIGQTIYAEEILVRTKVYNKSIICIRYSTRKLMDGGYTSRALEILAYDFNCAKDPVCLFSFFLNRTYWPFFKERSPEKIRTALTATNTPYASGCITPLNYNGALTIFLTDQNELLASNRAAIQTDLTNREYVYWSHVPEQLWERTNFDIALIDTRAIIKLNGDWCRASPASIALQSTISDLKKRGIDYYLIDLRGTLAIGPILTHAFPNGPLKSIEPQNIHYVFDKNLTWEGDGSMIADNMRASIELREKVSVDEYYKNLFLKTGTMYERHYDSTPYVFVRSSYKIPTEQLIVTQLGYLNGVKLHIIPTSNGYSLQAYHSQGIYQWAQKSASAKEWICPGIMAPNIMKNLENELGSFNELINHKKVREQDLQSFFTRNPVFLHLLGYDEIYPQLQLQQIGQPKGSQSLIPDFLVRPVQGTQLDIVELKKPGEKIVVGTKNRRRFSQQVMEGLRQLEVYYSWFESPANREWFRAKYNLSIFRPAMHLVIGNSPQWEKTEIMRLSADLGKPIQICTYAELFELGQKRLLL